MELLAPAGDIEKLKVAILYGADAVYLSGKQFGLRSASGNFNNSELQEAVTFAHNYQRKVYVVLNAIMYDRDLEGIEDYLMFLSEIKVDALIISDIGVLSIAKKLTKIPLHLSTQSSALNASAVSFWKEQGVSRIVLGREVLLDEAAKIKESTGVELEMFIHGSMCMSYSGQCHLSNYSHKRDSNRGGCAHNCRFKYELQTEDGVTREGFHLSSRDLSALSLIPKFKECGINSLKIEGRMKTHLYLATVVRTYRVAIDQGIFSNDELVKFNHRNYCSGSLESRAGELSLYGERESDESIYKTAAIVVAIYDDFILVEVKRFFTREDQLEILPFKGEVITFKADEIFDLADHVVEKTKPSTLVKIRTTVRAAPYNLIRMKGSL